LDKDQLKYTDGTKQVDLLTNSSTNLIEFNTSYVISIFYFLYIVHIIISATTFKYTSAVCPIFNVFAVEFIKHSGFYHEEVSIALRVLSSCDIVINLYCNTGIKFHNTVLTNTYKLYMHLLFLVYSNKQVDLKARTVSQV